MKYKIAILGSAVDEVVGLEKAKELGSTLGALRDSVILLNGACPGMPDQVIRAAREMSQIEIWGFSSEKNEAEQRKQDPRVDPVLFTKIFYLRPDFEFIDDVNVSRKYRNVLLTATCDAGIVVSGRWGTLNEFTNLYDMGKVIGVLTGTGGAADELPNLTQKISKQSKAMVVFDSSPQSLVEKVLAEVEKRKPS